MYEGLKLTADSQKAPKRRLVLKKMIVESLMLNAIAFVIDLIVLVAFSFLEGLDLPYLLVGGPLAFLLLLNAGILLLAGG